MFLHVNKNVSLKITKNKSNLSWGGPILISHTHFTDLRSEGLVIHNINYLKYIYSRCKYFQNWIICYWKFCVYYLRKKTKIHFPFLDYGKLITKNINRATTNGYIAKMVFRMFHTIMQSPFKTFPCNISDFQGSTITSLDNFLSQQNINLNLL